MLNRTRCLLAGIAPLLLTLAGCGSGNHVSVSSTVSTEPPGHEHRAGEHGGIHRRHRSRSLSR